MGKGNVTIGEWLDFVMMSVGMPSYGANVYLALHTSTPGAGGDQTTNEATYTGYNRVQVSRDASGWTRSGQSIQNDALLQFPQCAGGSNTVTYLSIGTAAYPAAGQIHYFGALNAPLDVSNLIQPQFAISSLTITEG